MRSTKQIDSTRVDTSKGVIFFSTTNVYDDGELFEVRFTKQDGRDCTYIGNSHYRYSNQQAYTNAIKRANKYNE